MTDTTNTKTSYNLGVIGGLANTVIVEEPFQIYFCDKFVINDVVKAFGHSFVFQMFCYRFMNMYDVQCTTYNVRRTLYIDVHCTLWYISFFDELTYFIW